MKGLELCRAYYEQYGKPMLEQFPELLPKLAVGMFGAGSQCLGYDDEVSTDHDFDPGFIIFLPGEDEVDRRSAFLLERAYAKLPKEFMGFRRSVLAPTGGPRDGVIRIEDFFREKTGEPDGLLSISEWFAVPEQSLLEATNGELYFDNLGLVRQIREDLSYYPEDIRRKKLAGALLLMGQSGQYNYRRCLQHGEQAAAQLAVCEFVRSTLAVIFLLNRKYRPFYKWSFRALRQLPILRLHAELLEYLLTTGNEEGMVEEKSAVIESIAADVIDALEDQELTRANCGDLEKHAYSVNDGISDAEIRNGHILAAV